MVPDSVRQQLRYVKVSDGTRLDDFPDFLIVGPQRTGTTWLHAHLRYHPEIMLSEPKELYFFNNLKTPNSPRFRSNELDWYLQFFREPLTRVVLRNAIALRRFGRLYRPKVRGEATASYAALDPDIIAEITALKPGIKVILMIRNPIDRAWSHAKKDLVRNAKRKFQDVAPEEFERFFTDPYQLQCARYVENIDHWSAALQPDHLLVGFFDDIDRRPEALLLEVMSFLGVTSDRRYISGEVRERVNPTAESTIPERHRRFLEALFKDELGKLAQRCGVAWPASGTSSARLPTHQAEAATVNRSSVRSGCP